MNYTNFSIGGKSVGSGYRPLIVVEMSGNHNGNIDNAFKIVHQAAECGADAIKLQTYTPATITLNSNRPEFFIDDPRSLWHRRRLWDLYEEAHTPWEWHPSIFTLARSLGLACISTAFDNTSLKFLLHCGVDALKIASFELIHIPLLEEVSKAGKPVLLSTGMASSHEIDDAVSILRKNNCDEFILLKCVSAYPSEEKDANVLTLKDMKKRYGCEVGLSDHTLRPYTSYTAVALGAVVIEKHVILNRQDGGVDAPFSLEPSELKELVEGVKLVWLSRGAVCYGPRQVEATSLKERPSIYVVKPVNKGEAFTQENMRIIRPGNGLSPKNYQVIMGKKAAQNVEAGVPLTWELLAD